MGKKLGVTDAGAENNTGNNTTKYIVPKEDDVENYNLACKLSSVKKLFKELREASIKAMAECREVKATKQEKYPNIWGNIDVFAKPVYEDLEILNELIEDAEDDYETPGKHCSITHARLCPKELAKRIQSFKCVI